MNPENEQIEDLLRRNALKVTGNRVELLLAMRAHESAMPFSVIQDRMKDMDRVTLYRTIKSLSERGIIHMAFQENDEKYYALCGGSCNHDEHHHDHVHFKCKTCGTVTCEQPISTIKLTIPNHDIHSVTINVEGICTTCLDR